MPLIIVTVGIGIIVLVIGLYSAFQGQKEVDDRIKHFVEATASSRSSLSDEDNGTYLSRFRSQFNTIFAGLNSEATLRDLTAANWSLTVSEFLFIRFGATLFSFLIALLVFRSIIPGVGLALLAYLIPGFLLFRSIQQRQKQFQGQLIDALTLIRGAIEAGYSFQQALNVIVQEMGSPTSEEFRQVRKEVELGLPLNRALSNMASRMESDDFYLVVTAVNINMQVGGNLTTILSVAIDTIRQRTYLFSELRSLTAYANFAGYLLTLLPVLTIAVLSMLSPNYWELLLQPGITRYILIYAICSVLVGNIVLRRMSKIRV
jgi:tight adherence protein B